MTIKAKYASRCPNCKNAIAIGDQVNWAPGSKASHVTCDAAPATPYVAPQRKPASPAQRARNLENLMTEGHGWDGRAPWDPID